MYAQSLQNFSIELTNMKIDIVKQWRATVRVQHQGLRAMMTELEARLALVCASTDNGRLLTGSTSLI